MPYKNKEDSNRYSREYYQKHRDKLMTPEAREKRNESVRRWRNNNPENSMYAAAKSRAKRLGQDFSIEKSDIIIPEICPILGIRLERVLGLQTDGTPSLDRIDNTKGYVKGNVRVISHKANKHKADLTFDQIKSLYEYTLGLR